MLIDEIKQASFHLVMTDEVAPCNVEILSINLQYVDENRDI